MMRRRRCGKENELILAHLGYTKESFSLLHSNREYSGFELEAAKDERLLDKRNIELYDFISGRFCNRDFYKTSIALAECFLAYSHLHGIIYPTMAMNANADNIAFRPGCIDDGTLQLEIVYYVKLTHREGMNMQYDCLDYAPGIDENGKILWRGRTLNWTFNADSGPLHAVNHYGENLMVDDYGNIISPD